MTCTWLLDRAMRRRIARIPDWMWDWFRGGGRRDDYDC
jgi:hypothetical protein